MTDDELKQIIVHVLQTELKRKADPKLTEVLERLKSNHVALIQWQTEVEKAPEFEDLLVSEGEKVRSGQKRGRKWVRVSSTASLYPNAWAMTPPVPNMKAA